MNGWAVKNIIAINGGPRKTWNTATLLERTLKGAQREGASTQLIHLYDLDFKGCHSCFACKIKGTFLDNCAIKDELQPVLKAIYECDAFIVGSPVYFGEVTGETRSFLERVLFPYLSYDGQPSSFGRAIDVAMVYTTNCPEAALEEVGYVAKFIEYERLLSRIFGSAETFYATETLQFGDYSKFASGMFDADERKKRHATVFRQDCRDAYDLGRRLGSEDVIEALQPKTSQQGVSRQSSGGLRPTSS
jgi:multimeric flavodoxin WrbA